MADDATDLIEEVVAAPDETDAVQADGLIDDVDLDIADAEDGEGDAEDDVVEEIEFDFGGNKMRVPKDQIPEDVAERLGRFTKETWSDYTKKSQDVVERAKSLEAAEAAVQTMRGLSGATLETFSQGMQAKAEIERLEGSFTQEAMTELWQSDPDQARSVSDHLVQLRSVRDAAMQEVSRYEAEYSTAQQAELARRVEEGKKTVEKAVKGFDPEPVIAYAMAEFGLTREQADQWPLSPALAISAHKAMLFDRLQAKAGRAKKPVQAEPVVPIRGRSAASRKDPEQMSTKEWVAWRNAQIKRRRG